MMQPAESLYPLVVDRLSFRYRDRQETSIQDISFQAAKGELLLVAGASGSGKTTLIRCINGKFWIPPVLLRMVGG